MQRVRDSDSCLDTARPVQRAPNDRSPNVTSQSTPPIPQNRGEWGSTADVIVASLAHRPCIASEPAAGLAATRADTPTLRTVVCRADRDCVLAAPDRGRSSDRRNTVSAMTALRPRHARWHGVPADRLHARLRRACFGNPGLRPPKQCGWSGTMAGSSSGHGAREHPSKAGSTEVWVRVQRNNCAASTTW